MIIFNVGKGEDKTDIADSLAEACWDEQPATANQVLSFDDHPEPLSRADVKSLVFAGHSDTRKLGSFNASEFAKRLNVLVSSANRLAVEHVYIVSCEVGAYNRKYECLAQRIADNLHKEGYANVKVHAIASPEALLDGAEMRVQVVERSGVLGRAGVKPGDLKAYVLNPDEAKAYSRAQDELSKLPANHGNKKVIQQTMNSIKEQSLPFLEFTKPQTALIQPQNTFKPREKVEDRDERIHDEAAESYHKQNRDLAVIVIEARTTQMEEELKLHLSDSEKKHKQELIVQLKRLKDTLNTADPRHYKGIVYDQMKSIEHGVLFSQTSTTVKVLRLLTEGRLIAAYQLLRIKNNVIEKRLSEAGDAARRHEEETRQAQEKAARAQAAREQAAREQAAREQATREQAAREQAAREKALREQETKRTSAKPASTKPASPESVKPASVPAVSDVSSTMGIHSALGNIQIPELPNQSDMERISDVEPLLPPSTTFDHHKMTVSVNNMKLLINALKEEDEEQKSSWCNFFYFSKTKVHKIAELEKLVAFAETDARDNPELFRQRVSEKRHNDFWLNQSWKTSHTKSLLNNIIEGRPEDWKCHR